MALRACQDDEDELESPSSLWATMSRSTPPRNPTRSRPTEEVDTPSRFLQPSRRTSPRFARSKTLEKTPPSTRATPGPSRMDERARRVEPKLSDSAERRRRLADELFPPSPPPSSSGNVSNADVSPTSRAGSDPETDWVADSEVEREDEERQVLFDGNVTVSRPSTNLAGAVASTFPAAGNAVSPLETKSLLFDPVAVGMEHAAAEADRSDNEVVVPDSQADDGDISPPVTDGASSLVHRLERLQLSLDQLVPTNRRFVETIGTKASTSLGKTPRAVSSGKTPRLRRQKEASRSSDASDPASSPLSRGSGVSRSPPANPPPSDEAANSAPTTPSRAGAASHPVRTALGPNDDALCVCCGGDEAPSSGCTDAGSAARWPDDVIENDGVLIYDPTPKKRPVKMPRARPAADSLAKSPRTSARKTSIASKTSAGVTRPDTSPVNGARSKLRIELDLTGDSSEEEEVQRKDKHASSSDNELPLQTCRRRTAPVAAPSPSARRAAPRLPDPPAPRTPASRSGKPGLAVGSASSKEERLTSTDRSTLPLALIRDLDRAVFRKRWNGLRIVPDAVGEGLPEGIEVVWNARLRNTAGRASWKTSKKMTTVDGVSTSTMTHHAMVELSTKVTDTAAKLRHTLAHELCHLATWAIDGEMKPPHGAAFKLWAKRVMLVRPDIEVTTTHSYEIEYKYRWKCVSAICGKIFGRHSASIDPATHGCPCGARIVPIDKDGLPKAGYSIVTATGTIVATPKSERKKSKWVEFLQSESPIVRKQNPTLTQPEVFKVVAERWKFAKEKAAANAEAVVAVDDTGGLDVALDSSRI